jgi:hypothetical protein
MTATPAQLRELVERWRKEVDRLDELGRIDHGEHLNLKAASSFGRSNGIKSCIRDLEQLIKGEPCNPT